LELCVLKKRESVRKIGGREGRGTRVSRGFLLKPMGRKA